MMPLSLEAQNLIHKYLTDTMSEEDMLAFDKYSKDELFMKALYKQSKIVKSVDTIRDNEVRSFISSLEVNKDNKDKLGDASKAGIKETNRKNKGIKLLLLFLTIFIAGYFVGNKFLKKDAAPNLFAEYYKPYPVAEVQRGTDSQLSSNYKEALKCYRNKEFSKALNLFKLENPVTNQNKLYQSICLIEQKEFAEANIILDELSKISDLPIAHEAQWNSVLTALVAGNEENIKRHLDIILNNSKHPFYQSAIDLKSKM